ncbi:MAG: flagellar hook-length control protein FliK, partial [Campylobacterota bacterium]|nr:flagellar hook-length control protein FliK [Campylobacterota bacterium]
KNSTIFKDMGSFSKDITQLQSLAKSQSLPQKIQTALSTFIKNIDGLDAKVLKNQISNSGIFLESKLATPTDAKTPIKIVLQELQLLLQKSTTQEAKQLNIQVKALLQELKPTTTSIKTDTPLKTIVNIDKSIDNAKLSLPIPSDKPVDNPKALQLLSQNIEKITKTLQSLHVKADIIHSKPMQILLETLQNSIKPHQNSPIEVKTLLPQIQELYSMLLQSKSQSSSSLLGALEKIVTVLKTIEQSLPPSETKVPKELQKVIDTLHVSIKKADPIVSKEMQGIHEKLLPFTKAELLSPKHIMSERIVHDMKANILQLTQEINQSPALQNSELAKIVDKLSMQIDYYQLYSHLNNSSSLYFPFVWDQLDEGSLSIKKVKETKFYCEINLNLKDHGELRVMLALYDENQINIHAFSESEILKNTLRENISILKSAFSEAELTLREIRFFDKEHSKNSHYNDAQSDLNMGFEVKV